MIHPPQRTDDSEPAPVQVCSVVIPTPYGEFRTVVFETAAGHPYLALTRGDLATGGPVLTRLHSECLTGDALGSLRCDCGVQLRTGLRAVAAEGRGVVLYLTGQEGRGIGLVNKLLAYVEQDAGADTVDANLRLGLPADRRDYGDAARVLAALGVTSVNLMSNNPAKADGLRANGMPVDTMVSLPTAPHHRNSGYLATKAVRMGHVAPTGADLAEVTAPVDVRQLTGTVEPPAGRPYVVLSYAQTVDGRLVARDGVVLHGLRAAVDAVLVGARTVVRTDPALTVDLVAGASPVRVVLDAHGEVPPTAHVYSDDGATTVFTVDAGGAHAAGLRAAGIGVREVPAGSGGVDLVAVLAGLRAAGVRSVLVEGGTTTVAGMLEEGLVDRLVVAVSPTADGPDLTIGRAVEKVHLANRHAYVTGEDVLLAWDVEHP